MKVRLILVFFSFTVFGIILSCTVEQKTAAASGKTAATQEPAWKDMDHEQKVNYMRGEVLPRMRQLFAEFDEEKFGRINCKTCHGDGATNESYEMPNPKLPKLPATTEGFQALIVKDSAMMNFMMHKVKPQMAQLLGKPEYDPQSSPQGFGCFNCHTMKK